MISATAPYVRLPKPNLVLKQSSQFISAHALPIQSALAKARRSKVTRTNRPKSVPSLVELLKKYPSAADSPLSTNHSPFLPSKYRAGHENAAVRPGQIRWRAPELKASARTSLCKQAFHWRLLKYILKVDEQNFTTTKNSSPPNFYKGNLSLDEYEAIKEDPVPRLINLLGGEERLKIRDKRYLGLETRPTIVARSVINPPKPTLLPTLPRYSKPTILPRFGPYEGRRKAFKGKIRERERDNKVADVRAKMEAMETRVANYRKEWKLNREKAKPALPF
ncbi:hypothetical protein CROQUDRAFT_657245 [Cronartium quercuum f. sp. fusiforme G11]|uniref:Large ribosomal subunit protein mL59 domain-containing protein n=1 Tax=Cronartium quercuum f. sp. fusiforme G11 TaxID=708437 RepID=A0A9P6NNA5_9BASI|nr:hypothetical protein CROQUDRAFT_657245 [Cronartium quercuum f. sp. fusiforme G11]